MTEPKSTAISAEEMRQRLRGYHEPTLAWDTTPLDVIVKQVAGALADDIEGKYRQALIELGWTPPQP